MRSLKILFVAAEMAPLVKVGGLGDVLGALPAALAARGHDARVLLPAYDPIMTRKARVVDLLPDGGGRILEYRASELPVPVLLLETPGFLRRAGRPYLTCAGTPWADDPLQFGRLGRVAADIAAGRLVRAWHPDVVHANDWHTGLAPVWMHLEESAVASVFTIHNLGYIGRFPTNILPRLGLPGSMNHPDALEFYGDLAFIKGGLRFADRLTTVSPRYAEEIQTPAFGSGLDGLLRARTDRLSGILNGIDLEAWNPATDPALENHFDVSRPDAKLDERDRLLHGLGLDAVTDAQTPVLAWVGRLTAQKGADLLAEVMPGLMERSLRLVVLGSGDRDTERALVRAARSWPGKLAVHLGFDEALAHQIYAGADMLLMPSRFEPCGLAQMFAMRYGSIPLVTPVGGLADTVIDMSQESPHETGACGFHLAGPAPSALVEGVNRAIGVFCQPDQWHLLMRNAMTCRFDWDSSAAAYERVYQAALEDKPARPAGAAPSRRRLRIRQRAALGSR
ncbi:MAG: glycogen synthase GlgA [Ectothiorhodospiraceae bacterium]|nr:glycogen synthase GlgA [Ectothiorhodospiraceae bacterium]